ncbi:unnamed protein product [Prorocentrum cordatum]|uniref:Uncharacterized protein n=1 Tax=Prorocentrum cordatum TaxID=2364126 RepID=A0ABN9RD77_9DINO|nr:unnamed protein product [Polarella glacialis]
MAWKIEACRRSVRALAPNKHRTMLMVSVDDPPPGPHIYRARAALTVGSSETGVANVIEGDRQLALLRLPGAAVAGPARVSGPVTIDEVKEANLPLSRNQTKALATSRKLRDALIGQPGWDIEGGDFVDVHGDLGGDAVSGSYRRLTSSAACEKAARCQGRKLTRLFRPSVSRARVFRAGVTAKASRGSAIMGVPSGRLRRLRVGAIKARGRLARGAALGLASLGQSGGWKRDPLTIVTRTVLMAYAEMVWASLLPEAAARSCLATCLSIAKRLHPWRMVKEPISALVLTLERVGWGLINGDPYRLHDRLGHEYQLRRYSPAFFGHTVSLGCRRAIGLEEVKRNGSSMWGWEVPPFWHSTWLAIAPRRLNESSCWATFSQGFSPWGLFPAISELVQRPLRTDDYFKHATSWPSFGPFADGEHAFADGSGLDQNYPSLRTAGRSIIVFDKNRRLVTEAWGSVPLSEGHEQLARDGEDYAVKVRTGTIAGGSFKLYCDCLATVRCAGNPVAAAAGCQRAHVWAGRAERLKDAEVIKVKAHLGPQTVREGLITQSELDGKDLVDARAKEGASAVRADINLIHCVEGLPVHCSPGGEAPLEIIDLGEWPADPAEADGEDTAPSDSADSVCTGESPLPGLDSSLRYLVHRGATTAALRASRPGVEMRALHILQRPGGRPGGRCGGAEEGDPFVGPPPEADRRQGRPGARWPAASLAAAAGLVLAVGAASRSVGAAYQRAGVRTVERVIRADAERIRDRDRIDDRREEKEKEKEEEAAMDAAQGAAEGEEDNVSLGNVTNVSRDDHRLEGCYDAMADYKLLTDGYLFDFLVRAVFSTVEDGTVIVDSACNAFDFTIQNKFAKFTMNGLLNVPEATEAEDGMSVTSAVPLEPGVPFMIRVSKGIKWSKADQLPPLCIQVHPEPPRGAEGR